MAFPHFSECYHISMLHQYQCCLRLHSFRTISYNGWLSCFSFDCCWGISKFKKIHHFLVVFHIFFHSFVFYLMDHHHSDFNSWFWSIELSYIRLLSFFRSHNWYTFDSVEEPARINSFDLGWNFSHENASAPDNCHGKQEWYDSHSIIPIFSTFSWILLRYGYYSPWFINNV